MIGTTLDIPVYHEGMRYRITDYPDKRIKRFQVSMIWARRTIGNKFFAVNLINKNVYNDPYGRRSSGQPIEWHFVELYKK